jgi:hypothetical protein
MLATREPPEACSDTARKAISIVVALKRRSEKNI